ncbi:MULTISPECIES: tripartite tricarboxylate transporter substrate binding protein [Rhodomicrobium]|uniref:Bug family tripartite tricarboxylate transporter substrate binding protein n=1 Tax=Rhodomicrobium TaxID=1068 RepID=UPI000B4A8FC2|nr:MULTISPECIES: tripartite tricarboxylate transporter substrate binding protein [Rhodomicrobium]
MTKVNRGVILASAAALVFATGLGSTPSRAEFPEQPIEMTVMFGAGSAADVTARHLAEGIAKRLNVAVPVVNRTGAGGAAGLVHISQQKPNGYSIVWTSNQMSTTYYSGQLPLAYDNFAPVARVSVETPALAVKADAPWKDLKEMLEYAKANPEKVRIGNSGAGSHTHLSAAALFASVGAKTIDVPFQTGQATVNLLGGRIEGAVQLPAAFVSHVKSGDLRIIAVLGRERDPIFPDVPTAKEQGFDVQLDMWRGIAAPKDTPPEVVAKLQKAIEETVASPEFVEAGKTVGFRPAFLPAPDFGKLIASDDKKLGEVMSQLGMKKTQ